jgi:hypothetical protein
MKIAKAEANPKHKMALVFRWYFAYCTRIAMEGKGEDRVNYQIQTGPALGSFNQWVKGTELEPWSQRHVDQIALKLMDATAQHLTRSFGRFALARMPGSGVGVQPVCCISAVVERSMKDVRDHERSSGIVHMPRCPITAQDNAVAGRRGRRYRHHRHRLPFPWCRRLQPVLGEPVRRLVERGEVPPNRWDKDASTPPIRARRTSPSASGVVSSTASSISTRTSSVYRHAKRR